MRLRRVAAPLAGVGVAIALFPATRTLSEIAGEGQLGPAFWPRLALLGLGLACLLLAMQEWRGPAGAAGARAQISVGRLAGGIVLLVAYAALAPVLGFPLTTAIFIGSFMVLAGARAVVTITVSGVVGTVALVYVFVKVVYLPLPKGADPFESLTLALYRALGVF